MKLFSVNRFYWVACYGSLMIAAGMMTTGCDSSSDSVSSDTELLSVVAISRHGIRSQLGNLEPYTSRPQGFPLWPPSTDNPDNPDDPLPDVAGNLSIFGQQNVARLGSWYRDFYVTQGLLPAQGSCPAPGTVYAYADVAERTIHTALGYLHGLFQSEANDCGVKVMNSSAAVDPIIVPFANPSGSCNVETAADYDVFNIRIGSPAYLANTYSAELQMLQEVTQSPIPLLSLSTDIATAGYVRFADGSLFDVADNITETFELEYAQGMPDKDCAMTAGAQCVGWGAIPPGGLSEMTKLHVMNMQLFTSLPSFAQVASTNLMWQLTGTMDQALSGVKSPGVLAPVNSRFTLFAAHDENVLSIAAFLGGVTWKAEGFQTNDPGPAGALVFELHRVKESGQHIVRLFYVIASLEQMRNGTMLTLNTPPQRLPLAIPACGGRYDCPYEQFKSFITAHVSQECIFTPPPAP